MTCNIRIILFNGPPRSGKNTLGEALARRVQSTTLSFARPLKDAVHALYGLSGIPTDFFEDSKDTPTPLLGGKTPRQAYIEFSEKVIKPYYGVDHWGRAAVSSIRKSNSAVCIFTDSGFVDETIPLIEEFGNDSLLVVQLHRDGCNFNNDSRSYLNIPEISTIHINNKFPVSSMVRRMEEDIIPWLKNSSI